MAAFLYRLGRLGHVHRRLVAGAWLLAVLAAGVGAATLAGPTVNSFNLPGTESQCPSPKRNRCCSDA